MRVAVLADIHGNVRALEAVAADIARWNPDQTIVAGDVVNRGPCSRACLQFVLDRARDSGWLPLVGNHDEFVLRASLADITTPGVFGAINQFTFWCRQEIGDLATELQQFPDVVSISGPDERELRVVHASMLHNRDNILAETSDAALRRKIAPAPTVFVCGHTHRPLVRMIDETLVVNAGSAGLPFDRDHRPAYARLEWRNGTWHAAIQRVTYDQHAAAFDFETSGFLDQAGPAVMLILAELQRARGLIAEWAGIYHEPVAQGSMSVEESIRAHLTHRY